MHEDDASIDTTCAPTGTPLPTAPAQLPVINDRYRVVAYIGHGGMGTVLRAHDLVLQRACAVKIFVEGKGQPTAEAQLAAGLTHPSIVPVHDFGTFPDGRHWMVMQLVEGADLDTLLTTRSLSLRRLLDYLLQVSHAIAHAHARGVVHRDLKPNNVRVDAYDAVFVLDWGIAERVGEPGERLGHPRYMAPEQAKGAISQPTMDVFALGRMLALILDTQVSELRDAEPLRSLVQQCSAVDPTARPADAAAFADALVAWFDGVDRRREASALIAQADVALDDARRARRHAARLRTEADAKLAGLATHTPAEQKFAGWADEDAAIVADTEARRRELDAEQLLQEALRRADDMPGATERLSTLVMERLQRAHRGGDLVRAGDAHHRLGLLDTAVARRVLEPHAIRLHTEPPGAQVFVARFETVNRRLVARGERLVGQTPLEIALPPGSHRLRFVCPERPPVILPIHVDWADPVDWIAPGETRPRIIPLPARLGENERYVPAGWCQVGGDDRVSESLPGRRIWVDGFIIEAEPLTCGALVEGLNAMLDAGEVELARIVGRLPSKDDGVARLIREHDGRFAYVAQSGLDVDAWPATQLTWHAARGWAAWRRKQTGQPWRLAHEIEWEKAARGADGRKLPWGDYFEPTWACVVGSRPGDPQRGATRDWPMDVSVYDVRGMAGNARTWCGNPWTKRGEIHGPRLTLEPIEETDERRILRGGFYLAGTRFSRSAGRYASHPASDWLSAGVRLVRSFTG